MCDYCNKFHSTKGITIGESVKIKQCATETDLKDCQVCLHDGDKPSIIIWDKNGMARGYLKIEFCPMCGRKLEEQ